MSFTVVGILIIIVGLYSTLFNNKLLYSLTIFFIPFSATAVINLGEEGSGTAIQPFMVLGFLWILSLVSANYKKIIDLKIDKNELRVLIPLLLFAVIALISLYIPYLIDGKEMGNKSGELDEMEPIRFTSKNITQLLYLFYGVIFAFGIYIHNRNSKNYERTIKLYAWSVIFMMAWGLFELACKITGIEYPSFIFNNSYSSSGGGYLSILEDGSNRISSVATEPSILNQSVFIILPFLFFSIKNKSYLFSKVKDISLTILIFLFLMKSASGSGMLSLFFLLLLAMFHYLKYLPPIKRIFYLLGFTVLIPILLISFYLLFEDIVIESIFNKSDSYSGVERISAIWDAWNSFLAHPLLGLGWGSITSFDLFIRILANTGILGLLSFIIYIYLAIRIHTKNRTNTVHEFPYHIPIVISFSTLIFSNAISGFSYTFGFFWFIAGLVIISKFNHTKEIT